MFTNTTPVPAHSFPLPCLFFTTALTTFRRGLAIHQSLGPRNSGAGGPHLSPSPRPVPSTHQVAQLGRLLLVIVQPSQGAGPVFVHPEAHASSNSGVRRLKVPRAGALSVRTLRRVLPRIPNLVTSLPAGSRRRLTV